VFPPEELAPSNIRMIVAAHNFNGLMICLKQSIIFL
jgi:hypothetical protein